MKVHNLRVYGLSCVVRTDNCEKNGGDLMIPTQGSWSWFGILSISEFVVPYNLCS